MMKSNWNPESESPPAFFFCLKTSKLLRGFICMKSIYSPKTFHNISSKRKVASFTFGLLFAAGHLSIDAAFIAAEEFCVTNKAQLEVALQAAASNSESDLVKIYRSAQLGTFTLPNEPGYTTSVKGGYDFECLTREKIRKPPAPLKRQSPANVEQLDQAPPPSEPPPARSTSGPAPPPGVVFNKPQIFDGQEIAAAGGAMSTISVPAYAWRHGCGPTALGMVLGYYDINGFPDLFDGSAATQAAAVNQGIASDRPTGASGHYQDYSYPEDSYPNLQLDRSEPPTGDEHTSDSIADFMETSFSSRGNYYGWSWSNDIRPAFNDYCALRSTNYWTSSTQYSTISGLWSVLVSEIDNGRPMIFLVDTDGNGTTDHFVTIIGYDDTPPTRYACWDTWSTSTVRWEKFSEMQSGIPWGIWGGWSFSLTFPGDVDESGVLTLADVILPLQITTDSLAPAIEVTADADVNGDNAIGIAESIYVLEKLASP
jgi:Peptidase_C39 like family